MLALNDNSNRLLNTINNNRLTALHTAVYRERAYKRHSKSVKESVRALYTLQLLMERHQAKNIRDNEKLMKYFIENEWLIKSQMIDDLELIAPNRLRWTTRVTNFEESSHYLQQAMQLGFLKRIKIIQNIKL